MKDAAVGLAALLGLAALCLLAVPAVLGFLALCLAAAALEAIVKVVEAVAKRPRAGTADTHTRNTPDG